MKKPTFRFAFAPVLLVGSLSLCSCGGGGDNGDALGDSGARDGGSGLDGHGNVDSAAVAPVCNATLFDNWNTAACATLTDSSSFTLTAPAQVDSAVIWVNMSIAGSNLAYTFTGPDGVVSAGTLDKGTCDPYQSQWCALTAHIARPLAIGTYTVKVATKSQCANARSLGSAFIRVVGCAAQTNPIDAAVDGPSCGGVVFDNWNLAACTTLTTTSTFSLAAPTQVDSASVWINTSIAGVALTYTLTGPSGVVTSGALDKGTCDPYQSQWCALTAHIASLLPAGSYTVQVSSKAVCANSSSSNIGFVRVSGCAGSEAGGADGGVTGNAFDASIDTALTCDQQLFTSWNLAACTTPTSESKFTLAASRTVDSFAVWVNTSTVGATALTYTLAPLNGIAVSSGLLQKGSCDPYQTYWCEMKAHLGMPLAAGTYVVKASASVICSNAGSAGSGFIRVVGCSI